MGWSTQSREGDTEVQVKGGESRDRGGEATTEFVIIDHSTRSDDHDHVVISASGDVIHDTTGSLKSNSDSSGGGGGSGK